MAGKGVHQDLFQKIKISFFLCPPSVIIQRGQEIKGGLPENFLGNGNLLGWTVKEFRTGIQDLSKNSRADQKIGGAVSGGRDHHPFFKKTLCMVELPPLCTPDFKRFAALSSSCTPGFRRARCRVRIASLHGKLHINGGNVIRTHLSPAPARNHTKTRPDVFFYVFFSAMPKPPDLSHLPGCKGLARYGRPGQFSGQTHGSGTAVPAVQYAILYPGPDARI